MIESIRLPFATSGGFGAFMFYRTAAARRLALQLWQMGMTSLGRLGGILAQLSRWFVRPQHVLRHAVTEAWVAASDLITIMRTKAGGQPCLRNVAERESALRVRVQKQAREIQPSTKVRAVFQVEQKA